MRILLSLFLTIFSCAIALFGQQGTLVDYVDPRIGTDEADFISMWRAEAGTYPGAVAPHGMVQVSPETSSRRDYLQGYYYQHDTIRKFGLVEHFSGWPNGSVGKGIFMPFTVDKGAEDLSLADAGSAFAHENETAAAGFYEVLLDKTQIKCRFTALPRAALGEFEFGTAGYHGLVMGNGNKVEQLSDSEIRLALGSGRSEFIKTKQQVFIHIQFDQPFEFHQKERSCNLVFRNQDKGAIVRFKVAASYTAPANALLNLTTDIPGWDFDEARAKSKALWEKELSRIVVNKGGEKDKVKFYTAMYHASLLPINATDVNRQYPGFEAGGALEAGETHYIYFTPWDAFRTLHPLVNFINPAKGRDYLRSALRFYQVEGRLPEPEVMTSVAFSAMFADALARGVTDFDVGLAYKGLKALMLEEPYFRPEMKPYKDLGHIPYPNHYATTATLEFAHNDWALAQVAKYLGDEPTYDMLIERSLNYQNAYNPAARFMLTKNEDGSWAPASIYAEANKWTMSWFAPHDTQGLINLMGGSEAFCDHLERNFTEGHYVLDNECPMNFPFLFSYAGQPWRTMRWKSEVLRQFFNTTPGGIPGNDDWGTMSSWYIWGALGLFPSNPGSDELIISGPIFEEVTLNPEEGKKLVIEAPGVAANKLYVRSCQLGGVAYNKPYLSQKELLSSGRLKFEMDAEPNVEWGAGFEDRPYSVTKGRSDFKVIALRTSKKKVNSNETFMIQATIQNDGEPGSFPLFIKDEEEIIHSEWVLLKKGERKSFEIPIKRYQEGFQVLMMGEMPVMIDVLPVKLSPDSSFVYAKASTDPFVHRDGSINIHSTVMNISGYEMTVQPEVYINGALVQTLAETPVLPGAEKKVSVSIPAKHYSGINQVRIGNGEETTFKVVEGAKDRLALHYRFDKDKKHVVDESGFGNHGVINGGVEYVKGVAGKGVRFTDGYISVPDSKSLDITGDELTMLCWYKSENENGTGSLITKGAHNMLKLNGKWQLKLAIGGWGRGQCFFNAKPKPDDPKNPIWTDEWGHFAGVGNANSIEVYYNGDLKNRLPHRGAIGPTDFEWRIGGNAEIPMKRKPDGIIDEVMIFAGALSEAEIKALMEAHQ